MSKTKDIYTKLLNLQQELKAPKGQKNSFGNYMYRSAEDILEAVKPLLKQNDAVLLLSDTAVQVGERNYIQATAKLVVKGKSVETTAFAREAEIKKGMDEAQITGSASSYARKYALNGLFAIDDTKDSDHYDNTESSEPVQLNNSTLATAPQVKLLLARARDFSGLADRQAIIEWFTDKTGVKPTEVKKADVDEMLNIIESERDV